jgi:hypothetical protein
MVEAARSLSHFVDTFYYANARKAVLLYRPPCEPAMSRGIDSQILRNLRKAALRIAHGPYANAMRAAAQAWQIPDERASPSSKKPRAWVYARLKTTMLINKPPLLAANQVTPPVAFICKALRAWLREHYPQACPQPRKHTTQKQERSRRTQRQKFIRREKQLLAKMNIAYDDARKRAEACEREGKLDPLPRPLATPSDP